MKITFILPFVNLTGGIKVLFEHANGLAKRGHAVTIIYPGRLSQAQSWTWPFEAKARQLKYWLFVDIFHKTEAAWFDLDSRIRLHRTPSLASQYIPNAEIVIATAPETVLWVADYPSTKGIKIHFAQDYETWYLPEHFLRQTFNTKMRLITIGSWQKKLYESFGRRVDLIVPNGVDLKRFNPGHRQYRHEPPVRVLMNYHHAPYKGMADGLAALKIAEVVAPIRRVMFGMHDLAKTIGEVEYHQAISEADLIDLYRSCDIFLWPTHHEGFGLPPMEAMACGTPVVGTATGAMPDYLEEGVTGFMVPSAQPKALGAQLRQLVVDTKLREKMGRAGVQAMGAWDWPKQTDLLEHYFISLCKTHTHAPLT